MEGKDLSNAIAGMMFRVILKLVFLIVVIIGGGGWLVWYLWHHLAWVW